MDKKSRLKQLRKLSLKNTEVSDVSLRYITQYLPQVNSNTYTLIPIIPMIPIIPIKNMSSHFYITPPALLFGRLGMLETDGRRDGHAGELLNWLFFNVIFARSPTRCVAD